MKAFKETALALAPAWRELFFTLHRCPELGRQEHRTAKLIRERLEALGIPCTPLADTGTMAVIQGGRPGGPSASGRTSTRCPSRRTPACPMPPGSPE